MAPAGSRDPPSSPPVLARPQKLAKMEDAIDISLATTALAAPSPTSTPVSSERPDAKTRRYDRQLRLWASSGQRSLESARILLIGDDASGCQALKNLVLPGIQQFTILSDGITTAADVATNFFLEPSSVGKPIALEEVRLLQELNPAVEGESCVADPAALLDANASFFLNFTLIIASNIHPTLETRLANLLWKASEEAGGPDIPLVSIRTSGLMGRLQIQVREHCIMDSHPDTTHTLRIEQPFPSLENYARSLDLDTMDSMDHSHIPWVVLLVRAASLWKESRAGQLPRTAADKDEFKAMLSGWRRKGDEENFDEALSQAYRVWTSSQLPSDIVQLFEDPAVVHVSQRSKNLHILLKTLQIYSAEPPYLPPVSPALPDMHSSTSSYVALQTLYKHQHTADVACFKRILNGVLHSVGLSNDAVSAEEIESFVKNVSGVGIIKGTPLRQSRERLRCKIENEFQNDAEPSVGISIYLAIIASEEFYCTHLRWPGHGGEVAFDIAAVESLALNTVKSVLSDISSLPEVVKSTIREVIRGGFLTPPTTAAWFGGIVGQEVIKLVTNQYTPLDNTAVVDLVKSGMDKFRL